MQQELMSSNQVSVFQKAEIDTQITTAKMYPRDVAICYKKAVGLATMNKDTAESCVYALPRGKDDSNNNKFIRGPSVRLAEICANAWGNLRVKSEVISNDGKRITAQGMAWDLESNYASQATCQRSIYSDKYKKTFSEDMQTVTGNAAAAIARRNAIFTILPLSFVNSVMEEANKIAIGLSGETLAQRIEKMMIYFSKLKISKEVVLRLVEKPSTADMSEDDLITLRGIANNLKDGNIKIDELLDSVGEEIEKPSADTKQQSKSEEMAAKIKAQQEAKKRENMTPEELDYLRSMEAEGQL